MVDGHGGNPGPAYDLNRTDVPTLRNAGTEDTLDYSSHVGSESYYHDGSSSVGVGGPHGAAAPAAYQDATETVHEMHLALLYLLSNPDEFKKAINTHPPRGATTLSQWNAEYDEDEEEESVVTATTATTPLPFVVFADDAEVVLPQAHTASQLFGIEKLEGIELEAAAGIPALSQLFLRWLALMPGGDHLNIIDPPGLTVMRIAGGRYRVTAAHRVVWTWMNEFASIAEEDVVGGGVGQGGAGMASETSPDKTKASATPSLQVGDLVSLTIVDVFETDNQGKLLSYCPTFDNRAVHKTNQATETIRKSSSKFFSMLGRAQKAVATSEVNKKATAQLHRIGIMQHAKNVAENVKHRVDEAVQQYNSPNRRADGTTGDSTHHDLKVFEEALSAAEEAATGSGVGTGGTTPTTKPTAAPPTTTTTSLPKRRQRAEGYVSGDDDDDDEYDNNEHGAGHSTAEI